MNKKENYRPSGIPAGEQKYKISVCIVIYNIKEYLERSVRSAMNQTYKNLEILLIDDGSTDGCSQLCDKLASEDERIRVIHKANGGVSSARNAAIENASGEYFTFLDGDDYIDPDMYETMLSGMLAEAADMAVCRYRQVDTGGEVISDETTDAAWIFEESELLEQFLLEDGNISIQNAPWNKLYKRSIIGELRFPPGIYEDALFTPLLLSRVKKGLYFDRAMYNYVCDRPTSIMNKTAVNSHVFSELIPNYYKRSEYIRSIGREDLANISDYFLYKRILIFVTLLNRSHEPDKKEHLKFLDGCLRADTSVYPAVYSCRGASKREYTKLKLYLASPWLYRFAMFINDRVVLPVKSSRKV